MAKVAVENNQQPSAVWTVDPLIAGQVKNPTTNNSNPGVENAAFYDSEPVLCNKLTSVRIVDASNSKKDQTWPHQDDTPVWYSKKQCFNGRIIVLFLSALVLFLLVAILATVAYLAIGEVRMTWENDVFQEEEDEGITLVEGHLRITNRVFNKDLLNPNSQSFHKLSAQVKQSVDGVFQQSALAPYYNETAILGYSTGSVIVKCRIHLSKPRHDATHQVGMAVIHALERHHGYLPGGILRVDIRSLHFTGLQDNDAVKADVVRLSEPVWGPWSKWSLCTQPCEIQTRHRACIQSQSNTYQLQKLEKPCTPGSDKEVRNCPCDIDIQHISAAEDTSSKISTTVIEEEGCSGDCQNSQICILLSQTSMPRCLVPRDNDDPTGCGGWCVGEHQLCRPLGNTTFQCIDETVCDNENEWQCSNGLCISQVGRCDGILDCYDMSDEYGCECGAGEFHCSNNTSCLPQTAKCNGQVDCWDGSDERNCTPICPSSQYACNNGHCIDKLRFCDGFSDCEDRSDEPEGCNAPCLHTQNQCGNGRCVNASLWCNGVDNCGDATDEYGCDSPKLLQSL